MSRPQQITIFWQSPEGRVLIGITHAKSRSRRRDRIEIRALDPAHARLPIGTAGFHAGLYSAAEIRTAGGSARFAERLILQAARSRAPNGSAPSKASTAGESLQPTIAGRHGPAPHPLEAQLVQEKTYDLCWNSPTGPTTITVTHTKTFFGRAHVVSIAIPPNTPFPLDTHSYIATDAELNRAGNAKAFVESLIAAAEGTASWRKYAPRAAQRDLFGAHRELDPHARPRPRRPRLTLPAPGR